MIDIIITTYNRPAKVIELVNCLLALPEKPERVIVVDSSDIDNEPLKTLRIVKYLKSSHKNQPYQRYLGFVNSESDYLVFLDDDMEVVDEDFIPKLLSIFKDIEVSGVAIKFDNKHEDSLLAQMPSTQISIANNSINKAKRWLSGWPVLPTGKFGLCGNRGKQPSGGGKTEWLSGGAFAAKRTALFQNFNFQLFDIFETKMGMGEDAIIGYGLSKHGTLLYHDELFFLHNDQKDSTYTVDQFAYAQRVMFSRLYLSLEKQRLDNKILNTTYFHYHYYAFWRIFGYFLNYLMSPNLSRKAMFLGSVSGWFKSFSLKYSYSEHTNQYWKNESNKDSAKY